jgi:hypothetical protein
MGYSQLKYHFQGIVFVITADGTHSSKNHSIQYEENEDTSTKGRNYTIIEFFKFFS